jgi:bile acid-coenzyme A ligase
MMHRIWSLPEDVRMGFDVSSLEMVLHMAAPCPSWLKQAWIDWLGPDRIWETYGGTEAVGGTVLNGKEWLEHKGSVGRPYLGQLRIVGENGRDCLPGEIGEISFLSPDGGKPTYHYLGTAPSGSAGLETYGDLGWVDSDGFLYIADRRTDLILTGGANIYPAETEAALEEHPAIASSVCVGLPDDDLGQRMHSIIELRPNCSEPEATNLEEFLSTRLSRHKLPYTYEFSETPLRDEVGKVRRYALRDERIAQRKAGVKFAQLCKTKPIRT